MSSKRRLAAGITSLGLVTAGLVSGATTGTADAHSGTTGQTVHVRITSDHRVLMPRTINPGVSTFKITSARAAGFQIIESTAGYSKREATRDANAAFNKNNLKALRRFEAHVTLLGGVQSTPGRPGVMSVNLPQGRFWALDTNPSVTRAAKVRTFRVSGSDVGGSLSGTVIAAVGDHSWARQPRHIPTHGRIWFENRSTANHFLIVAKLLPGKTVKDFARWVDQAKKGSQKPPPVSQRGSINTGVISPGKSMSFPYHLASGHYVMLCFWPDADEGGTPHVLLGMFRGLRVG